MKSKRSVLKRIEISGFKSISAQKPQLIELNEINVIIGANGSGKSNLISFFKMLNYMMTGAFQHFVGENGFANNLLYLGSKRTPLLYAKLDFEKDKLTDTYEFTLVKTVQDSLIFSEENIFWFGKKYPLDGGQKESYLTSDSLKHTSESIVKVILSKCRTFQFHDTSSTAHIRANCLIENNKFLMSDAGNIAAVLYLIKNKREYQCYYKRIVQYIRGILPQFDDFILEPMAINQSYIRMNWKRVGAPDYVFGPEQLSDGSIRFIALATLFLQPPELLPNVIILDEPELGLHPQAIDALASMIRIASRFSQIIIATQSPRIVDSFEPEHIIVAETDKSSGSSVFSRLDNKNLKDWLEEYSLSQLWEKNLLGGLPL